MTSQLDRYDRQIRAWGFETQRKLQASRFLFIGINATSLECMKNLVLAGAANVAVVASDFKTAEDQQLFQFIHNLNPYTQVSVVDGIRDCDIICGFDLPDETANAVMREHSGIPVLLSSGSKACVYFQNPEMTYSGSTDVLGSVEQALFGALLSQLLVDYLPPLKAPLAISLTFNSETLGSSVCKL